MHATGTTAAHKKSPAYSLSPLRLLGRLLISATVLLAAPSAWSQFTAPSGTNESTVPLLKELTVITGATVTNDSNLFRRPGALAQSETITSGYLGLRLDKALAQQQFQLDITKTVTRYDKFDYLNFDALSYSGTWNWRLGTRLSGKLSASRTESLAPFEDTLGAGRNVRISENQALDADVWATGGWHLLLGISQADQKSEQNLPSRTPDFRASNSSIGVKYLTRAGNSITARRQATDGEYTNAPAATLNTDYTEDLSELSAEWKLSGASALNARLGWLERDNKDPTRRDFSGPSSSLNYSWNPGGKLSMAVSAGRKTSPLQDLTASYREDSTLSVTPTWRISEKTSAFLRMNYQKSQDRGILVALPTGPRRDTTNTITAGMNWAATRKLAINASVERQQRTSTLATAGYDATIARIGASLAF